MRRKWAALGLLGRILTVALGLFAGFLLLGGILSAVAPSDGEPDAPAPSSTPAVRTPVTLSTDPVETPTATATRTLTVAPSPPPTKTVTKTAEVPEPTRTAEAPEPKTTAPAPDVYYENCDEARAAGAAPLHRGDPGYAPHLDRDGDGVACEPYVGH
ncbi:excalibur calcium-binding domain-containing protein [Streptomyces griseorubiginosus]|uniref:excalibur calcium-binding domain-containing protein n=1 Tax=Streptomyces griseorubiginosus TaxID=67304 RepID=UPI0036E0B9F8